VLGLPKGLLGQPPPHRTVTQPTATRTLPPTRSRCSTTNPTTPDARPPERDPANSSHRPNRPSTTGQPLHPPPHNSTHPHTHMPNRPSSFASHLSRHPHVTLSRAPTRREPSARPANSWGKPPLNPHLQLTLRTHTRTAHPACLSPLPSTRAPARPRSKASHTLARSPQPAPTTPTRNTVSGLAYTSP